MNNTITESPFLFRKLISKLDSKVHKKSWEDAIKFFRLERTKGKTRDMAISKAARTFGISPKLFSDFLLNKGITEKKVEGGNILALSTETYNLYSEQIAELKAELPAIQLVVVDNLC